MRRHFQRRQPIEAPAKNPLEKHRGKGETAAPAHTFGNRRKGQKCGNRVAPLDETAQTVYN